MLLRAMRATADLCRIVIVNKDPTSIHSTDTVQVSFDVTMIFR